MAANANMINANSTDIAQMDEQALRSFTQRLLQELRLKEVINEKLAFELLDSNSKCDSCFFQ